MATLKIRDLSVGDWVSFDTAHLTVEGDDIATAFVKKVQQPARIKSILGDHDLIFAEVDAEDGLGTIYLKMEHIRLIPITAEILEKNEFRRCSDRFSKYEYATLLGKMLRTTQVHLTTPQSINVFLHDTTIDRGYYHREKTSVSILRNELYVHDLQHALRLAELDKEIYL